MADELDAFLKEGAPAAAEAAESPAEAHAEPQAAEPAETEAKAPETPSEPAAKAGEKAAKEPEAKPDEEDDHALPVTGGDNRTVPFSALEKVRNDWKSKAAAAEAKAEELRRQLEEAKRPPPVPQAPPPQQYVQPLPDFNTNPQAYIHALATQHQQAMINERLNLSEAMLREKIGAEKVKEYQDDFRKFAEADPSLWQKLHSQPTPYQWLTSEIDRRRLHAEIGDDPSAFEARIREKVLAEIAAVGNGTGNGAENGATNGPGNGARPGLPAQPPSLAAARSVAGRTSPAFTGPPPMEQLFPGVENRRRPQR